jgi:hypothetical protein
VEAKKDALLAESHFGPSSYTEKQIYRRQKSLEGMIHNENQTDFVAYEPGCLEKSVPILALEHSPHSQDSWTPTFVVLLNFLIPGTGTFLASHCSETDAHTWRTLLVALA